MAEPDHNRIIAAAAKSILVPLGCKQKGRSRLWFDDHNWWITVIEFQPSSWSKGSYLNVGAMWLWYANDHWAFHDGYRVEAFHQFRNKEPFSQVAAQLGQRAADEVLAFRNKFNTLSAVARYLAKKGEKNIWDHYHAAMANALVGDTSMAEKEFRAVASTKADVPWIFELQIKAAKFAATCSSSNTFRSTVHPEVVKSRELLKLSPLSPGIPLWP